MILYKQKAEISWLEKTEEILKRKLAYTEDEYSVDGLIYRDESVNKGPSSTEKRIKFERMALDYQKANSNYEEYLEKKSLEEGQKAFENIVNEIKREKEIKSD